MTAIEHSLLGIGLICAAMALWRMDTDTRRLRRIHAAINRRADVGRRTV